MNLRSGLSAAGATMAMVAGGVLLASSGQPRSSTGPPGSVVEWPVTATDQRTSPANNSPTLEADPTDPGRLVLASRLDAPDFGCALHLSGDGGRSWVPMNPVPTLPAGAEKCYGAEVAFDRVGNLYFLFVGLHGRGNLPMGAFLTSSTDHGRTFSLPHQVLGPLNFGVRLAIDRSRDGADRLHLVWLHARSDPPLGGFPAGPNPVLAAYSDDGGRTFSQPVQVSDPDRDRVVAPALVLGGGSIVHVGYYDLGADARDYNGLAGPVWDGTWSVVVSTSLDGGRTFGRGAVAENRVSPAERPILIFTMAPPALAASGRRVCAGWTDARSGDADVLARCSSDAGRHWDPARRVNDDPRGNGLRQYLPRLAMASNGRLDVVYIDRRHYPTNAWNDVSYTFSHNGGRTYSPTVRLTSGPSSPGIGQRYAGVAAAGQVEIGSRLGLLAAPGRAVAAWPDTRYSDSGAPQATGQDIFSAVVELPSKQHRGALYAGGALVLIGVLFVLFTVTGLLSRRPALSPALSEPDDDDEGRFESAAPTYQPPPALYRRAGSAKLIFGAILLSVIVVLATRSGRQRPERAHPALRPQVVDVAMSEYRFQYQAPRNGGRTVFRVRNAGSEDHVFSIFRLPDDMPPWDEQLRGSRRRSPEWSVMLPISQPGTSQTIALDLVPGRRYGLACFYRTESKPEPRVLLGMNSEFRTG